jgi:hypothetical protein
MSDPAYGAVWRNLLVISQHVDQALQAELVHYQSQRVPPYPSRNRFSRPCGTGHVRSPQPMLALMQSGEPLHFIEMIR